MALLMRPKLKANYPLVIDVARSLPKQAALPSSTLKSQQTLPRDGESEEICNWLDKKEPIKFFQALWSEDCSNLKEATSLLLACAETRDLLHVGNIVQGNIPSFAFAQLTCIGHLRTSSCGLCGSSISQAMACQAPFSTMQQQSKRIERLPLEQSCICNDILKSKTTNQTLNTDYCGKCDSTPTGS